MSGRPFIIIFHVKMELVDMASLASASKHFFALAQIFSNSSSTTEFVSNPESVKVDAELVCRSTVDNLLASSKDSFRTEEAVGIIEAAKQILTDFHLRYGADERGMNASEVGNILGWGDNWKSKYVPVEITLTTSDTAL